VIEITNHERDSMSQCDKTETIELFIDQDLKEVFEATFELHGKTYSEVLEEQIIRILKSINVEYVQ
jgi:hypothetical protein